MIEKPFPPPNYDSRESGVHGKLMIHPKFQTKALYTVKSPISGRLCPPF